MTALPEMAPGHPRVETVAFGALLLTAAALQFSIAAANIFLALMLASWLFLTAAGREKVRLPAAFWWLGAYAAWTLLSSAFSFEPVTSFIDCKQLVLLLIVPAVLRLAQRERSHWVVVVIISAGGIAALIGIVQYGILEYDNLGRRPQGLLTHYMTYSGVLMLVVAATVARLLFWPKDRTWPGLVLPALLVALALTFTRSAWVGVCFAVALLFTLRDLRLLALAPVVAAVFFALAPAQVTDRVYSMFDMNDPTNRDRRAMLRTGLQMVQDHPVFGVGPDMITRTYRQYRQDDAVEPLNPHLHNVPLQIAAERGLPAVALWLVFIGLLARDHYRLLKRTGVASLAAGGLAATAAMFAAGQFEYNFGDSEFLMLYLVIITLPFAAMDSAESEPAS